jgi:hypothetical protein
MRCQIIGANFIIFAISIYLIFGYSLQLSLCACSFCVPYDLPLTTRIPAIDFTQSARVQDNQASLASHFDDVRVLDGVLTKQDSTRLKVGVWRHIVEKGLRRDATGHVRGVSMLWLCMTGRRGGSGETRTPE